MQEQRTCVSKHVGEMLLKEQQKVGLCKLNKRREERQIVYRTLAVRLQKCRS
jgi:chaperonin cofactor prefoldin